MNTVSPSNSSGRWPLPRLLILILAGAFIGLMVDIRVEHVEVVHERSVAWLPIIYAGFMVIVGNVAFFFWSKIMRRIMLLLFLVSFIIGGIGFYFHNHGNVTKVIRASVNAWIDPKMDHSDGPPQVAPLTFAGLAVIGILASLERFNTQEPAMPRPEPVRWLSPSPAAPWRGRRHNSQSHAGYDEL